MGGVAACVRACACLGGGAGKVDSPISRSPLGTLLLPPPPPPPSLILETDPATVAARVSMAGAEGELPLAEQTLAKVAAMAKEQIARSLLK